MKKNIIKISLIFIIAFAVLILWSNTSQADSSLNLNNLDFYVTINSNGDMNVTEKWDIVIRDTNTLFKSFKLDKDKYSSIEDVKVEEITDSKSKEFTKINEEMYHVTKDCYYGLKTSSDTFEIAWGVGLDDGADTRTYEISYTVKDAIGKYEDYAELYWQFVGADFEVDADKITGTIILPEKAENKEDIKVWGHTEGLNGEIYVTDNNKITFRIDNFRAGRYVEVRTLFPTNIVHYANREYSENRYNNVVKEETKWANDANARRKWEESKDAIMFTGYGLVVLALSIFFIIKTIKYIKKLKELRKYKPTQELEYFRDLPEENTTPGEALYIVKEPYNTFSNYFGKIFSATILDLKLEGYIDLRIEKNEKDKEKIFIEKIKEPNGKMQVDELEIYQFINKAINSKAKNAETKEIEVKELEKYIKTHSSSIVSLIKKYEKQIGIQLTAKGLMKETNKKESKKYSSIAGGYFVSAIIFLIWAFPVSIIFIINAILCRLITKKINVLTQEGVDSKEKWKALCKYMEDFSLLNEKEVPAITVWEKYLVYATVFGIADKVLAQLKTIYPNIDEMDTLNTSAYMYFMYHSNFTSSFTNSINSSISSSYSSGTGGGGGFSGGGGGGRWPEEVAVEDNTM